MIQKGGFMNLVSHNEISHTEFKQLVMFFSWLKKVRDQELTQVDGFEPLNELSCCVDEVQEKLLE